MYPVPHHFDDIEDKEGGIWLGRNDLYGESPDVELDWWAPCHFWTVHEAITLSLNLDPRVARAFIMERGAWTDAQNYRLRTHLASRAVEAGDLASRPKPVDFIKWAGLMGWSVPQQLAEQVEKLAALQKKTQNTPNKADQDAKFDTSVSKKSLLKILILAAVDGYGYEPGGDQSSFVKEIVGAAHNNNLTIDNATVLKYLREADEEFGANIDLAKRSPG